MDAVSPPSTSPNATDPGGGLGMGMDSFWIDYDDESPMPLDASEGGLFSGNFLPPPPRPLFLDDAHAAPDGPTTCDLCSWAWRGAAGDEHGGFDATRETPGELGWVLTLIIVSLTSALIGAIVMIVVLHCKRMKHSVEDESERGVSMNQRVTTRRPPIGTPDDKEMGTISPANFQNMQNIQNVNNGVWSWLARRSTNSPNQLNSPAASPAENHYTHMEDGYNSVGEALYAELDRDSSTEEHEHDRDSNSPAYQNSAYTDPDAPSAPSSAYYSDLSTTTVPERAYEVVGLSTMPMWEQNGCELRRPVPRLAAISENVSVPSDYV